MLAWMDDASPAQTNKLRLDLINNVQTHFKKIYPQKNISKDSFLELLHKTIPVNSENNQDLEIITKVHNALIFLLEPQAASSLTRTLMWFTYDDLLEHIEQSLSLLITASTHPVAT